MRDPGSVWAPLPEAGEPDGYTKTQFIVHSTGDNASADRIRRYFAQQGVFVESTFIVGETPDDPTLQVMDSTDSADANVLSNQRAIAVEVVGDGTGPFTEWQVSEIIRIGRWAANNHPIERRICPAYDQSGFGWHVMFGAPGPWTTVRGKVCPGAVRIGQLVDRIFPAIFASEEDDLPYTEKDLLAIIREGVATAVIKESAGGFGPANLDTALGAMADAINGLRAANGKLIDAVVAGRDDLTAEELEAAVSAGIQNAGAALRAAQAEPQE